MFENPENKNESEENEEDDSLENKTETEQKEADFEARYEEMFKEGESIKFDSEITFLLQWVHKEGLQTLINEYGSDEVFKVIKKHKETKEPISSTYNLICTLEPDRKKRKLLFDKMEIDVQETGAEIDRYSEEHGLSSRYSSGKSFVSSVTEYEVPVLRSMDKIFGGMRREPVMSRLELFVSNISQSYKDKDKEFMTQLTEAENNIFRLVQLRDKKKEQETNELEHEGNQLYQEIVEEIDSITEKLNTEFEKWQAGLLKDLSKIGSLDTESEEVKVVLEAAIKELEPQVAEGVKKLEQDVEEKTKTLRLLMKDVGSVHHWY